MRYEEWYRLSSSGEVEIYSQMYSCENPKAIIQIAHGMSEHSGRYEEFMKYLAMKGYAVCANDHLGHGKSSHGTFGFFARKPGGFDDAIEDIHTLFKEVKKQYPDRPLILLGHSMGSILAALFADRYDDLSKLILMGTPAYNRLISVMIADLRRRVNKYGYTHTSKLWNRIIWGAEPKTREEKVKSYEWLATDRKIVEDFLDDDLCGHSFTDSGNLEMMEGLRKWNSGKWGANISDIPIMLIAGTEDKIAGYGKGTKKYYKFLEKTHTKLTLKLIQGNRHEVLNEKDKMDTYQYILEWLNKS